MKNRYLYITLLSILAWHAEAQAQQGTRPIPKLVVNITIDQLRSDCLDLFASGFGDKGFRKLLAEGLVFEHGFSPFCDIDEMSAISSVVTGTTPFYHTVTGAQWIDRNTLLPIVPTEEHLAASTISDELKIATCGAAKVYAVAPTRNLAQLSGGHAPDGIKWNENVKNPWKSSDITEKALQLIADNDLGMDSIPDILFLTYEAGRQQREDYLQLDQALAQLVTGTEAKAEKNSILFILTSTGYTDDDLAEYGRYNLPKGTFYINRTANLLSMYLSGLWGQGKYVDAHLKNQLYLNRQLIENKHVTMRDALQISKEFLLQSAGVSQVDTHLYEKHCGDLTIHLMPGWQIENEDTHERFPVKTPLPFFPIVFYGNGIQHTRVLTPASIDRIAPSIAKAIRIRAPNACFSAPLF